MFFVWYCVGGSSILRKPERRENRQIAPERTFAETSLAGLEERSAVDADSGMQLMSGTRNRAGGWRRNKDHGEGANGGTTLGCEFFLLPLLYDHGWKAPEKIANGIATARDRKSVV